jgi:hypothetical protein
MKKTLMAGIAAATVMFAAAPAAAQVQFAGTTTGCFGAACAPAATDTLAGLTYTAGSFDQDTGADGFLGLGGTPDGLGEFSLLGTDYNYGGSLFTLLVSFSLPTGTTPSSGTFNAMLTGSISSVTGGGVFINFDNTPLLFDSDAGQFTFAVNDVSVTAGSVAASVTGQIQAAVPEPGTWAMMLLGFGAIGYSMRRRRKPLLQIA